MSSSQIITIHYGGNPVSRKMAHPFNLTKIHGGHIK